MTRPNESRKQAAVVELDYHHEPIGEQVSRCERWVGIALWVVLATLLTLLLTAVFLADR